jgi:hypothetical protein
LAKNEGIELRTCEQTKGRRYHSLLITDLPTNKKTKNGWGTKENAEDWIDLVASRGHCYADIKLCCKESLLPPREKNEKYLIWNI